MESKLMVLAAAALMGGCAFIPVQTTTLTKPDGGYVMCKQVGRGIVSYWVGKSMHDNCVAKARADGYD